MFKIDRHTQPRRASSSFCRDTVNHLHEENGKKWFAEVPQDNPKMYPGMNAGVEVNEIIAKCKTEFHDILLLNTTAFGKVLAFDGTIQITQKDCWTYYEMCTHLPLLCHPNPKRILIIGGLDASGLAKEIFKHDGVESIVHCEEDEEMVNLLKSHFNAPGFEYCDNPKFEYHAMDPKKFLKLHPNEYDIILSDFTVPLPLADGLFGESYFEMVKDALRPDGITITLSWGIWIELRAPKQHILPEKMRWLRNVFPSVDYYGFSIPSCATGMAGNIICSKEPGKSFRQPLRPLKEDTIADWSLEYYNTEIHTASFALPQFAKVQLMPYRRRTESSPG